MSLSDWSANSWSEGDLSQKPWRGRDASTGQPAWLAPGQYQRALASDHSFVWLAVGCQVLKGTGMARSAVEVPAAQDMGNESGLAQVTPYKLMEALKDSVVKRGQGWLQSVSL